MRPITPPAKAESGFWLLPLNNGYLGFGYLRLTPDQFSHFLSSLFGVIYALLSCLGINIAL